MKWLFMFALCVIAAPAAAYDVIVPSYPEAYVPFLVSSDFYTKTTYLGSLTGEAQLYELTVDVGDTLPIALSQRPTQTPEPFGLLVVKVLGDGKGVEEVVRQNIPPQEWTRIKDKRLGMSVLQSPILDVELQPGIYQIEVSTPNNTGAYALSLGVDDLSPGYFATLTAVRKTQAHFGYTIFRLPMSSYVYWPLGSMIFLYAFYKLYRLSINI